jgi:hypothetical protein
MRTSPLLPLPLWFVALCALLYALLWRYAATCVLVTDPPIGDAAPPVLAFWPFVIVLAQVLWKGVEVAGKITLKLLAYSVHLLWQFATVIARGVTDVGRYTWTIARKSWHLFRLTYAHVLKPAWKSVWTWVDKTERWFDRTFGPLLRWLQRLRTWLLQWYATYVRPLMDLFDVTRRALKVLSSFGLAWARALDRRLGEIQDAIDRPFRFVLQQLNEVINVVNRVITADGLFQRLALLRSIQRDIKIVFRQLALAYHRPLTPGEHDAVKAKLAGKPLDQVTADVREYMQTQGGANASLFVEIAAQWRKQLRVK